MPYLGPKWQKTATSVLLKETYASGT